MPKFERPLDIGLSIMAILLLPIYNILPLLFARSDGCASISPMLDSAEIRPGRRRLILTGIEGRHDDDIYRACHRSSQRHRAIEPIETNGRIIRNSIDCLKNSRYFTSPLAYFTDAE